MIEGQTFIIGGIAIIPEFRLIVSILIPAAITEGFTTTAVSVIMTEHFVVILAVMIED
jgi:hypothetical protein